MGHQEKFIHEFELCLAAAKGWLHSSPGGRNPVIPDVSKVKSTDVNAKTYQSKTQISARFLPKARTSTGLQTTLMFMVWELQPK